MAIFVYKNLVNQFYKVKQLRSEILILLLIIIVGGSGLFLTWIKIKPSVARTSTSFLDIDNNNLTSEQKEINDLIKQKKYSQAIKKLEKYRQQNPRNGEALIALNNTKIGDTKAHTIAIVAPFSDDYDKTQEMLRGVAQAQEEVNLTGGINDIPVKILMVNDSSDKQKVTRIAKEIAQNQNIIAIIGHLSSDNSLVASDIYEQTKILMITPTSTTNKLTGKGEYIKRTVVNDAIASGTLAQYVSGKLGKKKVAIFHNSKSDYSKSLKQSFINEYVISQNQVVFESDLSTPNFNAGAMVKQAINSGAEVIMLAANSSVLNQTLQVMQANNKRLPLVGGDSLYIHNPILTTACSDAAGMILAVPWNIKNHLNDAYVVKAKNLFKSEVSWRSAMSYNALEAIITAIENTDNPTRQSIQETLSEASFSVQGADGEVKFDSEGDRLKAIELVTVNGNNCSFEPVN